MKSFSQTIRPTSLCGAFGVLACLLVLAGSPAAAEEEGDSIETPRWKLEAGQAYPWRLTQQVDASQQLEAGSEASYQLKLILDAQWEVEQVDDQGAATIRQTVQRIQLSVAGPGEQTMQYDSDDEATPRGFAARLAPLAKVLIDHPLKAVLQPTGAVEDVEIPEAVQQQLQVAPGAKNLAALTGAESLEQTVQQLSFVLPEQPMLSVGDSWELTSQIEAPEIGPLQTEKSFRFTEQREVEGEQLAIFQPTIRLIAKEPSDAEDLGVQLKDQSSSGEILFNRTAGRLEKSKVEHAFAAEFRIGKRSSTQTIKQSVETVFDP